MKTIAVIGAGISGATAAATIASYGYRAEVFEAKHHAGGNCHTVRCKETGVMVHEHGPHIFHTNNVQVWNFVNQFDGFEPFVERTKAISGNQLFSFPINLHTLSQLYGMPLTVERARELIAEEAKHAYTPAGLDTMEGHLVSTVGPRVYERFFRDYTIKQWGRHPSKLPAGVAKRIPIRFDHNDNAFNDRYQGIPRRGYTMMIENMLAHPLIKVHYSDPIELLTRKLPFDHVICTAPIDAALDYTFGALPYRTLEIAHEVMPNVDSFQGCSVINMCDAEREWTRQTEHKHFMPWMETRGTVVSREFSREWQRGDVHYYPVRLADEERTLGAYRAKAAGLDNVTFMGRLGRFEYLNMDQAVEAAIRGTREVISRKL